MCIWKINTPHNAFIMTSVHSCVPNIFKHACHVWTILSRMCAIALFSDGRLLHIVWNVIRIHSMFFPSVMVQLRWIKLGKSLLVCLPLRFILVMLIIDCLHVCFKLFSHNAAQRQRTEVIFLDLNWLFFFFFFNLGTFLEFKTLTTEPREKTDHMMRGGRLVIFGVHVCLWVFTSRMRRCRHESLDAHLSEMSATLSKHLAQCRSVRSLASVKGTVVMVLEWRSPGRLTSSNEMVQN